jgi:chromate reductase, NAD(P)H dehydrogenase (quinone)
MKKYMLLALLFLSAQLIAETKVLAFAGSTRKDSYNKMLLKDAVDMARQMGAVVTVIDLKDYPMPFYDADIESSKGMPKNAKLFRQLMVDNDAFIIASPEYNASVSAVLKNALDWASRGENGTPSRQAFKGKKFAIMSTSPGPLGGARGLKHLQAVIQDVGGIVVPKQVSIPYAQNYFSKKKIEENLDLKEEIEELLEPATAN